ncbi:PIN domain-containing protein [Delftia sp.]|uniref:PIN domain-containing protein n=1 Tax=Delftia sp. TaxID=1886637 RepID=UPI00259CD7FF|nr:PIN domain-containing protein [Delftia sp.]
MMRVVLDTNVVLSALLFTSGRLAWIRRAWQHQQLKPLVCRETASELLRARLSEVQAVNGRATGLAGGFPALGRCRHTAAALACIAAVPDDKDQVFLVLAHVGRARALITVMAIFWHCATSFPA